MRPLPAPALPVYDRVVYGDYTPRDVVDEIVQMLGFDLARVASVSITSNGEVAVVMLGFDLARVASVSITSNGEVAVVTLDYVDGSPTRVRTLHRAVIR